MPFKIIISIISSRYISFFHFRRIFRTLLWIHGLDPREGEKRTFLNISLIFHLFLWHPDKNSSCWPFSRLFSGSVFGIRPMSHFYYVDHPSHVFTFPQRIFTFPQRNSTCNNYYFLTWFCHWPTRNWGPTLYMGDWIFRVSDTGTNLSFFFMAHNPLS